MVNNANDHVWQMNDIADDDVHDMLMIWILDWWSRRPLSGKAL